MQHILLFIFVIGSQKVNLSTKDLLVLGLGEVDALPHFLRNLMVKRQTIVSSLNIQHLCRVDID